MIDDFHHAMYVWSQTHEDPDVLFNQTNATKLGSSLNSVPLHSWEAVVAQLMDPGIRKRIVDALFGDMRTHGFVSRIVTQGPYYRCLVAWPEWRRCLEEQCSLVEDNYCTPSTRHIEFLSDVASYLYDPLFSSTDATSYGLIDQCFTRVPRSPDWWQQYLPVLRARTGLLPTGTMVLSVAREVAGTPFGRTFEWLEYTSRVYAEIVYNNNNNAFVDEYCGECNEVSAVVAVVTLLSSGRKRVLDPRVATAWKSFEVAKPDLALRMFSSVVCNPVATDNRPILAAIMGMAIHLGIPLKSKAGNLTLEKAVRLLLPHSKSKLDAPLHLALPIEECLHYWAQDQVVAPHPLPANVTDVLVF